MADKNKNVAGISLQSRIGLYGAYFFLTEMVGVVAPFLDVFLKKSGWRFDQIGMAAAMSGLGTLLFQIAAGMISDEITRRRLLLGTACVTFGICYAALPFTAESAFVTCGLLLLSGAMYAFFLTLPPALGLSLSGRKRFGAIMGSSQGFSHAGNIFAAVTALLTVKFMGLGSVFLTVALVCLLATMSLCIIRRDELRIKGVSGDKPPRLASLLSLFNDRRVLVLVASVALFQIANAPAMPLAALYLQHLEGNEGHVAWIVLLAQTVMVPISVIGAWASTRYGRKPVFAVAFVVLPLRLALFAATAQPFMVIGVQALDGFCAGIYDVIICIVCADLTRGKPGFNTLVGVMYTTVAFGSFLGPLLQGWVTEHLGFQLTFLSLAGIAAVGAVVFLRWMPETLIPNDAEKLTPQAATS